MDDFINWLGSTPASLTIQKVFWIIPTVQIVHILAISVVLSSMAMLDLRLMGLAGKGHSIVSLSKRFIPWLWGALIVLAVSGGVLIVGEPGRALGNVAFLSKMCMLATVILVTVAFQLLLERDLKTGVPDLTRPKLRLAKVVGAISLALWLGIAVAGRLIAYAG